MQIKGWEELTTLFSSDLWQRIEQFVNRERTTKTIFPDKNDIFNAFNVCSFAATTVVILGQDPYHNEGQANGLSFAVKNNNKPPPSLQNIFKELVVDIGCCPNDYSLIHWAQQGVLLLNAVLTVEKNNPNAHALCGWQDFTDEVIHILSEQKEHVVFILWGQYAKQKQALINTHKHLVLNAPHPSPFSAHRGFFGCGHFSQTNAYLQSRNLAIINWCER